MRPAADLLTWQNQGNWKEQAARVNRFVARFGYEGYRSLACHAALPLVLTPELVHYLRVQFLRDENVPWEAEVDLLLSDLCSQVGYELYTMDTRVRAYLLAEMKDGPFWERRKQDVAHVLISYVSYLSRIDPRRRQKELEAQRLAAMTYLGDEPCQQAVREIAERFKHLEERSGTGDVSEQGIRSELAYLARLTQELAPQLQENQELLELAQLVQRLLRNPEAITAEEVERSYRVRDCEISLSVFPFKAVPGQQEKNSEGFPPLQTLNFETGQFEFTDELITHRHSEFNRLYQDVITDRTSSSSRSIFAFIRRKLFQYNLSQQYDELAILQEVYYRTAAKILEGREITNYPAWIRSVAFRYIQELSRKSRRNIRLDHLAGETFDAEEGAGKEQVEESLIQILSSGDEIGQEWLDDNQLKVRQAFRELSKEEQELLQLRFVEKMTWASIRETWIKKGYGELSQSTLRKRGARALTNLRGIFHSS